MSIVQRTVRWMFTYRWRPVKFQRPPASQGSPMKRGIDTYKRYLGWFRRHWKLSILLFFTIPIGTGVFFRLVGGQSFSIYDEFGVQELKAGYSGGIWDTIWEFRGQPPGYEKNPDGILFVVYKTDLAAAAGQKRGLNGPLNPMFLPFEFVLVDLMIYIPAFLFGGIDIIANIDLFLGYFVPIPFLGRLSTSMLVSGGLFAMLVGIAALPIILIVLFAPFLVGWFGLPLIKFLLTWSVFNGLNLIKVIFVLSLFGGFIILPLLYFNPEILENFIEAISFWN